MIVIIYILVFIIQVIILFYLKENLKEWLLDFFSIITFAFIGVLAERLIDKQFDSITIIVCLIAVCMTVIFFWLRKKFSYSLNNGKKRKKKR